MLIKSQRLKNLKLLRHEFADAFRQLCQKEHLTPDQLYAISSLQPLYIQAILDGRANLNFGDCNYLAACFDKKLHISFID